MGKGNLEVGREMPLAGRGIPLGARVAVFGCPSMMISSLVALVVQGYIDRLRTLMSDEEWDKECGGVGHSFSLGLDRVAEE